MHARKLLQDDGGEDEDEGGNSESDNEDDSPGNGESGFVEEDDEEVWVSSSGIPISSIAYYNCPYSSCYVSYIIIYDQGGNSQQVQVTDSCLLANATNTLTYLTAQLKLRLNAINFTSFITNERLCQSEHLVVMNSLEEIKQNASNLPYTFGLQNGISPSVSAHTLWLFLLFFVLFH